MTTTANIMPSNFQMPPTVETTAAALPAGLKPPHSPSPLTRSALLRKCAHAFCMALQSSEFDAHNFMRTFFVPEGPKITEHGPRWARKKLPFLGQTFEGYDGCIQYFERLAKTLNMQLPDDAFPPDEELCVDADAKVHGCDATGVVCITGKGRFEHCGSGWGWDEKFIYRLSGFDEDGRVMHWEIWADPLSAMEAADQPPQDAGSNKH